MSDHKPVDPAKLARQQRLEQTLRENLKRRRSQAKARRDDAPAEATAGEAENPQEKSGDA